MPDHYKGIAPLHRYLVRNFDKHLFFYYSGKKRDF